MLCFLQRTRLEQKRQESTRLCRDQLPFWECSSLNTTPLHHLPPGTSPGITIFLCGLICCFAIFVSQLCKCLCETTLLQFQSPPNPYVLTYFQTAPWETHSIPGAGKAVVARETLAMPAMLKFLRLSHPKAIRKNHDPSCLVNIDGRHHWS